MGSWFRHPTVFAAAALVILTAGLIAVVVFSELPVAKPFIGVFVYSLIPLLFAAGAVVFYLALHQE